MDALKHIIQPYNTIEVGRLRVTLVGLPVRCLGTGDCLGGSHGTDNFHKEEAASDLVPTIGSVFVGFAVLQNTLLFTFVCRNAIVVYRISDFIVLPNTVPLELFIWIAGELGEGCRVASSNRCQDNASR